tara:strand:+ start:590 stop:886 length:297 start_codon:yes stop_codon:yes gene_type:complete
MLNVNAQQLWDKGENTIIIETPDGQPNVAITLWKHFGEHAGKVRAIDVTLKGQRNGMQPIVYHEGMPHPTTGHLKPHTKFDNANVIAVQLPTECAEEN